MPPETEAAAMVRLVPALVAYIPVCTPVTFPVDVEESAPVPLLRASIPSWLPETSVAVTVKSVPGELFVALMPSPLGAVTSEGAETVNAPGPLPVASMPERA